MTPERDENHFRKQIGGTLMRWIIVAQQAGVSPEAICEILCEQTLQFAADLHTGSDEEFLNMAKLALHTGPVEQ